MVKYSFCIAEEFTEYFIMMLSVVVGSMESARITFSINHEKTDGFILWSTDILLPVLSYRASLGEENNPDGGRERIVLVWTVLLEILRTTLVLPWESLKTTEQCFRIFWVMYLVYGKRSLQGLRVVLFALCIIGLAFEIFKTIIVKKAEKSSQLGKNPKYIAIYMNRIMEEDDSEAAPTTNYLKNCKYIISGEKSEHSFVDPSNPSTVQNNSSPNNLLTVGKLFQLDSENDEAFNSKYPCLLEIGLSFALAKMLRRRFSQLPLAEAGSKKALYFVIKGLMHSCHGNKDLTSEEVDENNARNGNKDLVSEEVDEDNAQRVFRIIGTELRFLTDILCIEVEVQKALLTSFKRSEGKLTSGQSSLQRHNVHHLKWACQPNQSNTEAMLVWNIATTLFDDDDPSGQQSGDRTVALKLSEYCEFLLRHHPELLPDAVYWAEGLLKQKDEEISNAMTSDDDRYKSEVCRIRDGKWNENSVLGKGVNLFNDLKKEKEGRKDVWKILADFWAEMMLYIAPSDNVKGHEKILEKRELITQLWALLSHAGIIARPEPQKHHDDQGIDSQVTIN